MQQWNKILTAVEEHAEVANRKPDVSLVMLDQGA